MRSTEKSSPKRETVAREIEEIARKSVHYHKYENITLTNKKLYGTARTLYDFMLAQSYLHSNDFVMSIAELAEGINRSSATTRRHLNYLIRMGFVTRVFRKDTAIRNWNLKSLFIVHPVALGTEIQEQVNPVEYVTQEGYCRKMIVPPLKNGEGKDIERKRDIYKKLTLTREAKLPEYSDNLEESPEAEAVPQPETHSEPEKPKTSNQGKAVDLSDVPDVMRPVAEYLLLKTGRSNLTPNERRVIREILDKKHMPARVMKEIRKQVEAFTRRGKNLHMLTFNYIGKILEKQDSLKMRNGNNNGNDNAVISAPTSEEAQETTTEITEQILPVEEAEKIISEYTPAVKKCEGISPAMEELHERIRKRGEELAEQYLSKYPKDEDGCYIFPEVMEEGEGEDLPDMTLDDYLRLKFPEADEKMLRTDRLSSTRGLKDLQEAFEIDRRCANCTDPETCPFNRKNGRPIAMIAYGKLEVGYTIHMPCKHDKAKPDPEFERRMKRSGLTENQAEQTFATYNHAGMPPEVVSAKAKAILAAKNHSSLVLAGRPGTGKTHLATAVAIEAMKAGSQALFRTVPELLDELRRADWEHTDFYGLRQKFCDVPCLVLDDLGKEKTTEKGLEYLYQILDYRYRHGMQTIVTTNALDMGGLMNKANVGKIEPLISRLLERGEWVAIRGAENHRLAR
ncbi:MAG: ATP-binding protein [Synergistaceae bacterium]|nr:ATP-binding protein [Synergistaceae bacterium]